jgi:hypothetical protein
MATPTRSLNHLGFGLLICMGCSDQFEQEEATAALEATSAATDEPSASEVEEAPAAEATPAPSTLEDEFPAEGEAPSAGWLEVEGSSIFPYCSGVLIAPRTAITSTSCATSTDHGRLRFGLGLPGGAGVGIVRVTTVASEPRLALLELESELDGAFAIMASDMEANELGDGAAVEGVGLLHARRGASSDRWIWPGTLRFADEAFRVAVSPASASGEGRAYASSPNCHGDNGSGIYTQTGALLGIVVAVGDSEDSDSPCVDSLILARTRGDELSGLL